MIESAWVQNLGKLFYRLNSGTKKLGRKLEKKTKQQHKIMKKENYVIFN